MNQPQHIELGRPARPGQLILERRYNLARELIPDLSQVGSMLDLGCGNGAQTIYFASSVRKLVGVDVVPIESSEANVGTKAFDFIKSDAGNLPFGRQSFDLVTAFEVLEHFPDDQLALKEVSRILKFSGRCLFSVPNKWWLFESHGATVPGLNWLPWNRIPLVGWLPDALHRQIARARIYTMKKAIGLAENAGLKVVSCGYITAPLDVLPEGFVRRIFRGTLFKGDSTKIPFFAVNLFVLCQKEG